MDALFYVPVEVGDLSDVDVDTAAPTDGQTLVYVAADDEWVPGDAAGSVTSDEVRDAGRWEVVVSGTAPPVATTNEAEDDWVYGWISG